MSIIRFDPFRGFESLTKKFNDLSGEFEKGFNVEFGSFAPRIDIAEDEKNIFFHVELPGIKKEDVKVSLTDGNVLVIKGEKKREEKVEDKCYIRVERNYGSFSRSFELPDNVKSDSISAKFDNGVLNLSFEKIEPQKPKEVEVKID